MKIFKFLLILVLLLVVGVLGFAGYIYITDDVIKKESGNTVKLNVASLSTKGYQHLRVEVSSDGQTRELSSSGKPLYFLLSGNIIWVERCDNVYNMNPDVKARKKRHMQRALVRLQISTNHAYRLSEIENLLVESYLKLEGEKALSHICKNIGFEKRTEEAEFYIVPQSGSIGPQKEMDDLRKRNKYTYFVAQK